MAEADPSVRLDPSSFSYVVGIDIGSETCCFTILTPQRKVVLKPTEMANLASGFAFLEEQITRLGEVPAQVVVGLEATSRYGENLFHWLQHQGYHLCLLHPRQTHEFAKQRGLRAKTDRLDATTIARITARVERHASAMCLMSRSPAIANWCVCIPNESR